MPRVSTSPVTTSMFNDSHILGTPASPGRSPPAHPSPTNRPPPKNNISDSHVPTEPEINSEGAEVHACNRRFDLSARNDARVTKTSPCGLHPQHWDVEMINGAYRVESDRPAFMGGQAWVFKGAVESDKTPSARVAIKFFSEKLYKLDERPMSVNSAEIPILYKFTGKGAHQNVLEIIHGNEWCRPGRKTERSISRVIITKWMEGGNLESFLGALRKDGCSEEEVKVILFQLLTALKHIHSFEVVHRDIKPENLLLECRTKDFSKLVLQLADFGIACDLSKEGDVIHLPLASPVYKAPETSSLKIDVPKVDVWSVLVVGLRALIGELPKLPDLEESSLWDAFWKDLSAVLSQSGVDLFRKMAVGVPGERISIEECLKHPWFKEKRKNRKLSVRESGRILRSSTTVAEPTRSVPKKNTDDHAQVHRAAKAARLTKPVQVQQDSIPKTTPRRRHGSKRKHAGQEEATEGHVSKKGKMST